MTVSVLSLFLTVPWVGLQCVIVIIIILFARTCVIVVIEFLFAPTLIAFLMFLGCWWSVSLSHGAVGWSGVCDCGHYVLVVVCC